MYLVCSENKGTGQLCRYHAADLHFYFRIYAKSRFPNDVDHLVKWPSHL